MIHNKKQLPDIQKKAGKALGAFLVVMALLTVLSRAAANIITPRVTCTAPQKTALKYKVTATGTVKEKQQQAVNTVPGIRVKKVLVSEGDHVLSLIHICSFHLSGIPGPLSATKNFHFVPSFSYPSKIVPPCGV